MEGTETNEPAVAIKLSETLALIATMLTNGEFSCSDVGDVIILTPTGLRADGASGKE